MFLSGILAEFDRYCFKRFSSWLELTFYICSAPSVSFYLILTHAGFCTADLQCPANLLLWTAGTGYSTSSFQSVPWEENVQTLHPKVLVFPGRRPDLPEWSIHGCISRNVLKLCFYQFCRLPQLIFKYQSSGLESARNLFVYVHNQLGALEPYLTDAVPRVMFSSVMCLRLSFLDRSFLVSCSGTLTNLDILFKKA